MLKAFLAFVGGLATTVGGSPAAAQALPVGWTLTPAASRGPQKVQLGLSHRSGGNQMQISRTVALDELPGLTPAQLASAGGAPTRFRIVREAGTLDCGGNVRQGRGAGDCTFRPDAGFAAALRQRGIAAPSPQQQFMLAMHNLGLELLGELHRRGYRGLDLAQLTAAAIHGITPDYLRALDAAGHRGGSLRDLVRMRIHRVSPADVRAFAALGYTDLSPAQLVSLSIHRVTPAFVRDMAESGYRRLTPEQLVRLRIGGIDADEARRANAALRRR